MSDPRRIDVHQHALPPRYADWVRDRGIGEAGGRALPEWSAPSALAMMDEIGTATGILSVSAPATVPARDAAEATRIARDVNDFSAETVKDRPDRFGFFATVPLPYVADAAAEAVRALDDLEADGVILLANTGGTYLGQPEHDELFAELDSRSAVVFIHPTELPGPAVPGIVPFAADFLLDTSRAAYLLVRNDVCRRYARIKFILSHAGGFVPFAAHRMAMGIAQDLGRDPRESLQDMAGFYFDTALSATPTALPSLLAFAKPGHVLFGSDFPFAPREVVRYFTDGLDAYPATAGDDAINRDNALVLFPRLAGVGVSR